MSIPPKANQSHSRLAYQDKFNERESWFKLVVKIISWKEGLPEGGSTKITNKITSKEWDTYCKHIKSTNTTYDKQHVLTGLKETQAIIEKHGGFEDSPSNP